MRDLCPANAALIAVALTAPNAGPLPTGPNQGARATSPGRAERSRPPQPGGESGWNGRRQAGKGRPALAAGSRGGSRLAEALIKARGGRREVAAMSCGCGLCALLVGGALLVLLLQLLRWLRADGDLTLLWAEWRGKKPENELRGKVVWVTGASSGIGEELAYQLSKIGALLAISARREDELERVKKRCLQISNLSDKDILVLRLDLTDRSSHEAATNSVLKHFGKIDVLVNNGGRSQRSLFVDTNLDVFSAIMELNYLGTISLTKHVLDHMIQRRRGKIVTVSSVMGIMGAPLASGYCASKHALQGFFNSLRTELTDYPEISIINICPGPVQSKIIQNVFTEKLDKSLENSGDQSHKMPTERCVRLTLVSTVNDLKEAWISDQPYLAVCYLWQYAPTWAWWLMNRMGKRRIENFKSGVDADASYSRKKK
ncbi:dehydrogenase/reductase SDR family member 7 [Tympanuchus pallidicinctus]|uniref:dehydrogenase/reductase SDR family member 7 n=1 Tax=Tympanuchus pallidicinctus TaxID=109042 RepID=UPI0022872967|nr:dehydrogenase/reductase SDR family member 7 [Tympanuchus pallidicinctus]